MSAVIPAEYKALTPYIKRAEELANDTVNTPESKYVSYYCLLYAIERGMKIVASDQTFLYALFEKAEHNKILFGIDKIESNKEVICENFAFTVFSNADNEDRSGAATMATAKSFYAASIFLDILEQFNPSMEEEVLEKRKYAKWRSSEIIKALKEGRAPSAPTAKEPPLIMDIPPVTSTLAATSTSTSTNASTTSSSSIVQPQIQKQSFPFVEQVQNVISQINPFPGSKQQAPGSLDGRVQDAIEQSAFAIAALKYNDIPLARKRLEEALKLLT